MQLDLAREQAGLLNTAYEPSNVKSKTETSYADDCSFR